MGLTELLELGSTAILGLVLLIIVLKFLPKEREQSSADRAASRETIQKLVTAFQEEQRLYREERNQERQVEIERWARLLEIEAEQTSAIKFLAKRCGLPETAGRYDA